MHSFLMQDWITVRGPGASTIVSQSESEYLDMRPFQDVVFWVDVRSVTLQASTTVSINFETAPAKEDGLFVAMRSAAPFTAGSQTTQTFPALLTSASVPVSRWMRWKVTATSTTQWDITFRIWASAGLSGR